MAGNANVASNWISEVRWDEQGRPYRVFLMETNGKPAGTRTYLSPAEAVTFEDPRIRQWGEANGQPGNSFLRERGRWNPTEGKWDQPLNFGNIGSAAIGATFGGAHLAGLGGGGGGAAQAGTLPNTSGSWSGAAIHGPASIASQGASAGIPASAALGAVQPVTEAATSGGGGVVDKIKNALTSGEGVGALASLLPLLVAGGFGGGGNNAMDPSLSKVLAMNEAQMRRADPLHQAAVQLAFGNLPTYAREGIDLPRVPLP